MLIYLHLHNFIGLMKVRADIQWWNSINAPAVYFTQDKPHSYGTFAGFFQQKSSKTKC